MTTVVFPGRFQPFHKAHWTILQRLMRRFECVIIAIGSSNLHSKDNPFSAQQRKQMIELVLKKRPRRKKSGRAKRLANVVFAFIPYAPDYRWVNVLLSRIPRKRFDVVFTNNPRVQKQLRKHGIPYISSPLVRRHMWRGARIRDWPSNWKQRLPASVTKYVNRWLAAQGVRV